MSVAGGRLELESRAEPIHGYSDRNMGDFPPAYDALSIHQVASHDTNQPSGPSAIPGPVAGPSRALSYPYFTSLESFLNDDRSPPRALSSLDITPSSPINAGPTPPPQRPPPRKNSSWFSHLPFASTFSAKKARQSVLSIVSDLAVIPSGVDTRGQENVHETFAFLADTCAEHKLSLSAILQETFVDNHTPMYWAIVNSHEEFLVALLVHSRPLIMQTISDIRCACLVKSNQTLFHALRVRSSPFHVTDGIQVPSLLAASNAILGDCPTDEIHVQQASAQGFIVTFDIPLWQKRLKAIGQVDIEFIASGRMWSITFFSAKAQSKTLKTKKSKRAKRTWHVMVSLLESSPPTFFDSLLIVDALPPLVPDSTQIPRLQEAGSETFPLSHDAWDQKRSSMYDYGRTQLDLSKGRNARASWTDKDASSSVSRPLPIPPLRGLSGPPAPTPQPSTVRPPSISIRLGCGSRKLGRRAKAGEALEPAQQLTTPNTWSEHGVGYTNAAVSPVGEGLASQLLYERSQYVFPDGTLRGRLEARFVKLEESKGCIIC